MAWGRACSPSRASRASRASPGTRTSRPVCRRGCTLTRTPTRGCRRECRRARRRARRRAAAGPTLCAARSAPPPSAVPAGALEAHGGVEITAGVGAIDRRLYGQLVSNGAIIARLRDDDEAPRR